jgi:hypothetical protein
MPIMKARPERGFTTVRDADGIEHGSLVDREAARAMREHVAFVVPALVTYASLARDGAPLGLPAASVAKIETVRQARRDSLAINAEAGVPIGFGADLLGEMHQDQSDEFPSVPSCPATWKRSAASLRSPPPSCSAMANPAPGALADIGVLSGQGAHHSDARGALVLEDGQRH